MGKHRIFISHISEETQLAKAFRDQLLTEFPEDLEVFVSSDRKSIEVGKEWLQEVKDALREASILLVMCSVNSIGKPWVNFEAGGGWLRDIPLIPICHSGMLPEHLPVPLKMLNGLEAAEPSGLQKLHDVIAKVLGCPATDNIDRTPFTQRFKRLESDYLQQQATQNSIKNPKVLCATTTQYGEPQFGFESDLQILKHYFGGAQVDVERNLTSQRLRELLRKTTYQVIHLVMYVDGTTGELIFSHIDKQTGKPIAMHGSSIDKLSPRGFANQLKRSGVPELVFLATCQSLYLGVDVGRVTNMVATHVAITGEQVKHWAECFYSDLCAGESLYEAADAAIEQSEDIPLRLIPHHDFAIAPIAPITTTR